MSALPLPAEPMRLALIGAGNRAQTTYLPLWESLKPWCRPVAVCDPVAEHGGPLAAALGVPAYTDIRQLVRDRPMEAALVVTPVESHHSLSVYLSSHGIHNHTETTWASMVCQARQMIAAARETGWWLGWPRISFVCQWTALPRRCAIAGSWAASGGW